MMILRKKEVIAASLVVLIGMAGYLNWSYQDTVKVTDGESYIETGKKLGEAQYVNSIGEVEETSELDEEAEMVLKKKKDKDVEEENQSENAKNESENKPENKETASVERVSDTGNYFEQARLDKETSRARALEILNQTAQNQSFNEETTQKAGDKIINTATNVEKESEIESIAQSKGYSEICVYIDEENTNIIVRKQDFSDDDVVKLTQIAIDQLKIPAKNVKIVEVK